MHRAPEKCTPMPVRMLYSVFKNAIKNGQTIDAVLATKIFHGRADLESRKFR